MVAEGCRSGGRAVAAAVLAMILGASLPATTAGQNDLVAAAADTAMQFGAPFQAVTPASALAPSSGTGPLITSVTRNPSPQPSDGQSIPIVAVLGGAAANVTLIYLVNYGPEQQVPMTVGINGQYLASIPAAAFKPSDMVRWYVTAIDANQQASRSPPLGKADRYFGTVIADPSVNFTIPVMEWFTNDITSATTKSGTNGTSIFYLGRFYDNVFAARKGVTALSWPKPKLKFKLGRNEFVYKPQLNTAAKEKRVKAFDLNSLYYEPGQKSYMREPIAYQVLQDAGAVAALSYHLVLRLNGEFYGLYTYVENDDNDYLERNGLSKDGVLIKSTSGSDGNLGPSVPVDQLQYSYKQQNKKKVANFWPQLHDFTQGIAGAGNLTRSKFVFDYVELSETINTLAVQTMLLTQDRCTKNYLLYLDLNTSKWQMVAYDLKSALNADAGYGGTPAKDYCTLECPQWNSPLYCDRNHPQDVTSLSGNPWTFITSSSIGRRLLDAPAAAAVPDNGPNGANVNITNPDENLVALGNLATGPAGTYNYLVDLITQVPATRQMYMRRLRTLTDEYYPTGKLASMVTDMYQRIRAAADVDNQKWRIGNITLGYLQLIEEQIPTRQKQLLEAYGPTGSPALLPAAQPADVALSIGRIDATSPADQQFVELLNNNTFAVDVSKWQLTGAVNATIKPGTVIAGGNTLVIATSVHGFKQRSAPPTMGQGFQVIGKIRGDLAAGGPIKLVNSNGRIVDTKAAPSAATAG